ncbi:hypothetical protein [Hydrogenophaga sp. BPS33]|uniref:hypothetical protein n=1 Tax=Hydrogenophaga sp. BPS33 TaxID=2651974 RepID=UPI00131F96CC|nr:hypothetical protein [Hydrogenophaga sp. BPS33]QHE87217.1 hypothetical protein F9K07_21100 [Hydrogenophaga sp. BPS33]
MSGPKVVRVVTREELVAAGETLLSRLNQAVVDWQRSQGTSGVSNAEQDSTKQRRDKLETLLREDKFADFERAATAEVVFLNADATRRREAAAQAKAVARARALNGKGIATALLAASSGFAADLQRRLEMASRGELALDDLDRVLSEANRSLATLSDEGLTEEQKQLATRLGAGAGATVESWRAQHIETDKRLQEVLTDIAELELLRDVEGAASTQSKLDQLLLSPASAERSMRMDSLQMAIRHSKTVARQKASALAEAEHLATQLSDRSSNAALLGRLKGADMTLGLGDLEGILVSAREELLEVQKSHAASARRRAVLDGLRQLGYTLHEGLGTAATENGGLVMKSPNRPGYGVQVMGAGDLSRMQVRSVAFHKGRDMTKDRAEEETWCGDFSNLQEHIASLGGQLVVEKALGVGATPLREIVIVAPAEEVRRKVASVSKRAS